MSDIVVGQAVLADLEQLVVLFEAYRAFQGQPADLPAARAFLQARFDHGDGVAFVARDGSSPVGFAQLYPSHSSVSLARVFILNDLFVLASARRRGVAARLLSAVEAHAWSLGAVRVTLNVAQDNFEGQALYEDRGWHRDAQFFMYHRFPPPRNGGSI